MDKFHYKYKKYKQKYNILKKNSQDINIFNSDLNKNNYEFDNFEIYNNKYKLNKINSVRNTISNNSNKELKGFLSFKNNELMIGLKNDNKKIFLGKIFNSPNNNEVEFYNKIYKKSSNYKKYKNTFINFDKLIINQEKNKFMLIYKLDLPKDIFSITFNNNNKYGFDIKCLNKNILTKNSNKSKEDLFNKSFQIMQNSFSDIKFSGGGIINNDLFNVFNSLLKDYSKNQINNIILKLENIWSGFVFDNYINMILIVDNINLSDPFIFKDNNRYMNVFNKDLNEDDIITKLDNFNNIDIITSDNRKDLSEEQLYKLKNNVNIFTFGFLNLIFAFKSYSITIFNEALNLEEYVRKFRIYHKDDSKSFHHYYKQLL